MLTANSHNITIHSAAYDVYIGDNSCEGYKVCWYTDVRGAAVTVGDNLCVGNMACFFNSGSKFFHIQPSFGS